MTARPCDALLWIALTAIASPAFGQTAPTEDRPTSSSTKAAASIPDFSGIWAHPFLTGFEPPASGPGPVLNTSRSRNGVANFQQLIGDYTNPILKPHAAEIVKKHGEMSLRRLGLSDAQQPVLARRRALCLLGLPDADVPDAGPDHFCLPPRQ